MITQPGQAIGVSLTTSRGLPVIAVASTDKLCCAQVQLKCKACGTLGAGFNDCCIRERLVPFTNGIPAASCCCICCSHEISAGVFYVAVGTRQARTPQLLTSQWYVPQHAVL